MKRDPFTRRRRCPVCRKLIPLSLVMEDYFWGEHIRFCNREALATGKPCVHPPTRLDTLIRAAFAPRVSCLDCGTVLRGGAEA